MIQQGEEFNKSGVLYVKMEVQLTTTIHQRI